MFSNSLLTTASQILERTLNRIYYQLPTTYSTRITGSLISTINYTSDSLKTFNCSFQINLQEYRSGIFTTTNHRFSKILRNQKSRTVLEYLQDILSTINHNFFQYCILMYSNLCMISYQQYLFYEQPTTPRFL